MAGKHFNGVHKHADNKPFKDKNNIDETVKIESKSVSFFSKFLTILGFSLLLVAAFLFARDWYKYHTLDQAIQEQQSLVQIADVNQPPTIDWEAAKKKYPDIVAWIYIPETVINYPVVQGASNDTYLHTLPSGESNDGGSIFLDSANIAPGMVDENTILYGHHMKNGTMFKRIADMQTEALFNSVKTIWYITEHKTYELHPVFYYLTDGSDGGVRTIDFPNREAYNQFFINRIQKDMPHVPNAVEEIKESDRMLTLSTCYYDLEDGRAELICSWKDPDKKVDNNDTQVDKSTDAQSS